MSRRPANRRAQVRIIGGKWRGRKLQLASASIRPTPDRTRVTLFNWLSADLPGSLVLDLFAGTGVLGFEALSRGADHATFVDNDRVAIAWLLRQRTRLDAIGAAVEHADALRWLASQSADRRWDLIFLDPPFASPLLGPALGAAAGHLSEGGFVYAEADDGFDWDANAAAAGLRIWRRGSAGAVRYGLLHR
ncbi:MAG: 16S rRNA (guanine(966)-N(2))-methyltransferase RsmD [Gammaproteobacteria bacterium]|nr:16S rRNA (guanine(966)-N(2))-methyltransferase RsmD [Gammaproteobacteria bacterium]MYF27491.1 16S rRNA (guanine(966)-N(2))-methyltransferase RsmD [Gammaproteobacteria bacterium]MYK46450.1 16S rRNA (guanine(966)-N(2))-methyltransferase RsmD [Gammaproteobacteria bacterium]